jgi:DNA-binding transcriptional regulator LsrR (DeoR family)
MSNGGGTIRGAGATDTDHLRLLARVARMYHERGMRQPQIADELNISQPRVSRLLKQASQTGIVRTVVTLPSGVYTDLEEEIQGRYGLKDVVVVDVGGASDDVIPALGAAAGSYLDVTLKGGDDVGISTWSATLLAAVDVMAPKKSPVVNNVVQIVGGVGNPDVQFQATRLTGRFADLTGARPTYLPAPGLVSSPTVRKALLKDTSVIGVTALWDKLTLALVGVGSLPPSALLRQSGNAMADEEQEELRSLGAVGDVCLRFFDASGDLVRSKFDQRVVGISPAQLRKVPRRVGVAGGRTKYEAIRGSVLGGWVNILITDLATATHLVEEPS